MFQFREIISMHTPIILYTGDVKTADGILYLPAYMAPFL